MKTCQKCKNGHDTKFKNCEPCRIKERAQRAAKKEQEIQEQKDLREKLIELKKEAKFIEENKCYACLEQQKIQHKIDQKAYDKRLLANAVRDLVCHYCQHSDLAVDGDDTFCVKCGASQSPSVSYEKYSYSN